jgi:UDP-N-acetylmuramoyl-tripeptide--D-alanyl-D-alanine ligase
VIALTLAEIAAAVGGTLVGGDPAARVTGPVEFDSRKMAAGGLFVAFAGANVDGHDFVDAARAAGAVAVLGTRPTVMSADSAGKSASSGMSADSAGKSASSGMSADSAGKSASSGAPTIVVTDCLAALGELARAVLDRLPDLTVIGITGSSGKTSTKDLIVQLLSRLGPTVGPAGSFNNELGLPHTVLQVDGQTRFLVLEMGARGPGHLTYLCRIAPPRIGVVVNVGVAHIGEFGSVDAIEAAKGELVEALPPDGLAVLNADDDRVRSMVNRTTAAAVLVGEAPDALVRARDIRLDERGRASFRLDTPEGELDVTLGISGRHQVTNALLAAAVARSQGLPLAELGQALGELRLVSTRRMDVFDRPDGVTVIDDSYNANPASTAVALRALTAIGRDRRTIAVLGYLAELGEQERAGHLEVGRLAAELGVDRVVVVGDHAAGIHDGTADVVRWGGESVLVPDQDAALRWLREQLRAGDVVLVKGSRYRTWDVVDGLRSDVGVGEVVAP